MRMRLAFSAGLLAAAALDVAHAQYPSVSPVRLDIESQPLDRAINIWAQQTGVQVLVPAGDVASRRDAPIVKGSYTPEGALKALLAGTDLEYHFVNTRTVAIHLAQAEREAAAPSSSRDTSSASGGSEDKRIAEVVVTAQKREERLIDTPQSVTVVSSSTLADLNATQFRDFASTVSGLSFQTAGPGWTQLSLRGVTAGFDVSPTVAVYVDDVPYGSNSSAARGGQLALDVAPFDLDRIEVLRGPQGTLYGASTMGGLIKYVTRQPDTSRVSGYATAGLSGTQSGGSNYNVVAGLNAPIVTDKVALRGTAFETHDGGYINNISLGRKDVNSSDIYGGRLDLLFTPSSALSLRINSFLQNTSTDGFPFSDRTLAGVPVNGTLVQSRPSPEGFDQHLRLVSGTLGYDFGPATLTSISSYQTVRSRFEVDISPVFLAFARLLTTVPLSAVGTVIDTDTDKFTQEVRLTSNEGRLFEWIVGAYYTDERSGDRSHFVTLTTSGQPTPNNILDNSNPSDQKEYAGFGDLTWHVIEKLDLTGGLRYARTKTTFGQAQSGVLAVPGQAVDSSDHVFTYLANARYTFTDRAKGYLRYATGYRPGGPNFLVLDPVTRLPLGAPSFESDRLKSYEVGFKADTAERRFGIDFGLYYIDWDNIQVTVSRSGFVIRQNAPGGATSRGADLTLYVHPIETLSMTGTFGYQNAYMNEATPSLKAAKGERLPNVPHFNASWNADYRLSAWSLAPTLGATVSYVGERTASYNASTSPPQYRLPSYTTVDLRFGMELGSVSAQIYAHNLTDEHGEIPPRLSGTTPATGPYAVGLTEPRTIGVSVTKRF